MKAFGTRHGSAGSAQLSSAAVGARFDSEYPREDRRAAARLEDGADGGVEAGERVGAVERRPEAVHDVDVGPL